MSDTSGFVERVEPLLLPFLERQGWYWAALQGPAADTDEGAPASPAPAPAPPPGRGGEARVVQVERAEVLREDPPAQAGRPGLARFVVSVDAHRFHVVVGWREPSSAASVLRGRDFAILGAVRAVGASEVLVYDALADDELMIALLEVASEGKSSARRARLVESLTSHASIVYDDRLFMKLYRVLEPAPRPEVEVMLRLDEIGFNHIVAPVANWRGDGSDLALVREFFSGALEGRSLALTSLRDLLGSALEEAAATGDEVAARAGGDLAGEIRRLGETTGRMHTALAEAFGIREPDPAALAAEVGAAGDPESAERIRALADAGAWIRVHGDYHLRRVMRTDVGWIVVGFGDDPSRAAGTEAFGRALRGGTPLEDVADMCFSLEEVARSASEDQEEGSASAGELAGAWARRNAAAFVEGYLGTPGLGPLLPREPASVEALLAGLASVRRRRAGERL